MNKKKNNKMVHLSCFLSFVLIVGFMVTNVRAQDGMQIFIRKITGESFTLYVEVTDRIESVKAQIESIEGIPINKQRLIYSGRELINGNTLQDYSVYQGVTVDLVERIIGTDFTISGGVLDTDYTYENNVLTILTNTTLTINGATVTDTIKVANGVNASIILDGVDINLSDKFNQCPLDFGEAGESIITFYGVNSLKGGVESPGILVPDTQKIVLEGTGELNAYGGSSWPAIGRNENANIEIRSGEIYAQGGSEAAGIGGSKDNEGGNIFITGGKVTAMGDAIGIGGGKNQETNGQFSTGLNSNPIITTNGIGNIDDQDNWSGIIFNDIHNGIVYRSPHLLLDLEIAKDQTLTVNRNSSFTISSQVTLKNNGIIQNFGQITNNGIICGNGIIRGDGILICNHHSGGTATCSTKATCYFCGQSYGELSLNTHTLTYQEKVESCIAEGTMTSWQCDDCHKYFNSSEGLTELTDLIIPATGHSWSDIWSTDAIHHWHECQNTYCPLLNNDEKKSYGNHQFNWVVSKEASIEESGTKYEQCFICNKTQNENTIIPKLPKNIDGVNQIVTYGESISFKSDANIKDFQTIFVDGKEIANSNYTATPGSTIITLTEKYIRTLSEGNHTISIILKTGSISIDFIVTKPTIPSPESAQAQQENNVVKTGDTNNITLWTILFVGSIGVFTSLKRYKTSF